MEKIFRDHPQCNILSKGYLRQDFLKKFTYPKSKINQEGAINQGKDAK
jgi:hypothetical protein